MAEALVSDLIAIIRQTAGDPGPRLAARLEGGGPDVAELSELARRARAYGATDEELALSIGVLLATSRASRAAP